MTSISNNHFDGKKKSVFIEMEFNGNDWNSYHTTKIFDGFYRLKVDYNLFKVCFYAIFMVKKIPPKY